MCARISTICMSSKPKSVCTVVLFQLRLKYITFYGQNMRLSVKGTVNPAIADSQGQREFNTARVA